MRRARVPALVALSVAAVPAAWAAMAAVAWRSLAASRAIRAMSVAVIRVALEVASRAPHGRQGLASGDQSTDTDSTPGYSTSVSGGTDVTASDNQASTDDGKGGPAAAATNTAAAGFGFGEKDAASALGTTVASTTEDESTPATASPTQGFASLSDLGISTTNESTSADPVGSALSVSNAATEESNAVADSLAADIAQAELESLKRTRGHSMVPDLARALRLAGARRAGLLFLPIRGSRLLPFPFPGDLGTTWGCHAVNAGASRSCWLGIRGFGNQGLGYGISGAIGLGGTLGTGEPSEDLLQGVRPLLVIPSVIPVLLLLPPVLPLLPVTSSCPRLTGPQ